MTSATTRPARGAGEHHAGGRGGLGLVTFAGVALAWLGANLMYGAAAIANSHVLKTYAQFVFGTLALLGWVTLRRN